MPGGGRYRMLVGDPDIRYEARALPELALGLEYDSRVNLDTVAYGIDAVSLMIRVCDGQTVWQFEILIEWLGCDIGYFCVRQCGRATL